MKKINGLRFIVGSGCNYNCLYCHHEGYFENSCLKIEKSKLEKIFAFTQKHTIHNISITGGEPFLYWENTKKILEVFNSDFYIKTLNTNVSLIGNYIDELNQLNPIEFHVNFSSLDENIHTSIIEQSYLSTVLQNLELLRQTKHKVCLNIPVLKKYNIKELKVLYNYAKENGFLPRFLVVMPVKEDLKEYVTSIDEIIDEFGGGNIIKKYGYGLYKAKTPFGTIDIVKCLCDNMECEMCKANTYMHLTPNLDIKYCMNRQEEIQINFEDQESIEESFELANKRLELVKR